jgi:hypothetical protein
MPTAEAIRLQESHNRTANWQRWGTYLAERQWGTVREDYSPGGDCWSYFPHDHARSRAYRWGEDGLLGFCDRECRLCFALALWNGRDPFLKERLFGLAGPEGNHGEDVKECYYYLDATPTYSYVKSRYKYPQAEFPYARLVEENRRRGRNDPEFELTDTGIFEDNRYFDVTAEYAKRAPDDILIRITIVNRAAAPATLHLLPTLWFRNSWVWGCTHEGCEVKPRIDAASDGSLVARHATLGTFRMIAAAADTPGWLGSSAASPQRASERANDKSPRLLFTDNETNNLRLFKTPNASPLVKDAFHDYVIDGKTDGIETATHGTKAAWHYVLNLPPGAETQIRLRLFEDRPAPPAAEPASQSSKPSAPDSARGLQQGSSRNRSQTGLPPAEPGPNGHFANEDLSTADFDTVFDQRIGEADEFYAHHIPNHDSITPDEQRIIRQAYAGLITNKQFYHFVIKDWLDGDPNEPTPPPARKLGRNHEWPHLFNRDVISMPDKWEYPWYAAWDLAFHMLPMARIDPEFAKSQLLLFLREWYMHPNGEIPAYEFEFSDVNPPVHAWACWRVYKMTAPRGHRDILFLRRAFHKLLLNFTWWVNRKDPAGRNLFTGGFLGLDNIGVFDRSRPLPGGGTLEQADGTAWMAFYCSTMLAIALELAADDPSYEDIASKFFEHFIAITDAMNCLGGMGLWNDEDGFYYDVLSAGDATIPLRVRSMVGIIPLFAVEILPQRVIDRLPGFKKRFNWVIEHRQDLARHVTYCPADDTPDTRATNSRRLLAIPSRERLVRVLRYLFDESEFLSPYGIRALSRYHLEHPYVLQLDGQNRRVAYVPGDSDSGLFGGNSNWRGPVWFPVNFLLIESLERYHHFYGDKLKVEFPTGSGRQLTLNEIARELATRLTKLFLPDASGKRPCHAADPRYANDPHWRDLILFHEYFHGDTGRGLGASHQTGWTALITNLLHDLARFRTDAADAGRSDRLVLPTDRQPPAPPGVNVSSTQKRSI